MGKHSPDTCEWPRCGKKEKDMTFVSWVRYGSGGRDKGLMLCKKHELKSVDEYIRESERG